MKAKSLEWNDVTGTYSYAASPFIENGGTYTIWKEDTEDDKKFYLMGGAGLSFPPGVDTLDEAKAQAEALNQERAEIFLKTYYEVV